MIVLDIETSGLTDDCGIWEIGAINLGDISQTFLQEARIDKEDNIQKGALLVTGKTEEELRDVSKQSQKQMIENYLNWVEKQPVKIFYGQNVGWDISMIQAKCIIYGLQDKFLEMHSQRGMDLHTIAQEKYFKIHGKYLLKENGISAMNLGKLLNFCGMKDKRITVRGEKVVNKGNYHNAMEDCKLEGEALMRLKFGKNLFLEYNQYKIPDYLK